MSKVTRRKLLEDRRSVQCRNENGNENRGGMGVRKPRETRMRMRMRMGMGWGGDGDGMGMRKKPREPCHSFCVREEMQNGWGIGGGGLCGGDGEKCKSRRSSRFGCERRNGIGNQCGRPGENTQRNGFDIDSGSRSRLRWTALGML